MFYCQNCTSKHAHNCLKRVLSPSCPVRGLLPASGHVVTTHVTPHNSLEPRGLASLCLFRPNYRTRRTPTCMLAQPVLCALCIANSPYIPCLLSPSPFNYVTSFGRLVLSQPRTNCFSGDVSSRSAPEVIR